jgi:hypothetical protein
VRHSRRISSQESEGAEPKLDRRFWNLDDVINGLWRSTVYVASDGAD